MAKLNSIKGFTLIEFLIAAGVLFLAIGLAVQAAVHIRNSNDLSSQIVIAMEDAHRAIELMRQQSAMGNFPANITDQFPEGQSIAVDDPFSADLPNPKPKDFQSLTDETIVPTYSNVDPDLLNVTVTVTWTAAQKAISGQTYTRTMSRQLTALLAKR